MGSPRRPAEAGTRLGPRGPPDRERRPPLRASRRSACCPSAPPARAPAGTTRGRTPEGRGGCRPPARAGRGSPGSGHGPGRGRPPQGRPRTVGLTSRCPTARSGPRRGPGGGGRSPGTRRPPRPSTDRSQQRRVAVAGTDRSLGARPSQSASHRPAGARPASWQSRGRLPSTAGSTGTRSRSRAAWR